MIYFIRKEITLPFNDSKAKILEKIRSTSLFTIEEKDSHLLLVRNRWIPNRVILRMFIPRLVVKVIINDGLMNYKMRLDGFSFFFLFILIGGIAIELTMDRISYPREYPPAFVYVLATVFFSSIIYEIFKINKDISQIMIKKDLYR